jgi:hypothetical protein
MPMPFVQNVTRIQVIVLGAVRVYPCLSLKVSGKMVSNPREEFELNVFASDNRTSRYG